VYVDNSQNSPTFAASTMLEETELALCTERVEIVLSDPPPDIEVTELPVSEVASGLGSRFQSNKLTGGACSRFHSDK